MALSLSDVHVDAVLTGIAIELSKPGMVADKVAPHVKVLKESDKYYKFIGREDLTAEQDASQRAPGARAHEIVWTGTTDNYSCTEFAFRNLLPDRVRDNADAVIRPRARVTRRIMGKLWLGHESRVQAFTQNTGTVTGGAVTTCWDASGGVPDKDIDAAKQAMKVRLGQKPNAMLLNGPAAYALRRKLKANSGRLTLQEEITFSELPAVVYGLRTIVAESTKNTAALGQTLTIADVWDDTGVLLYIEDDPGVDSFTFAVTFMAQNLIIKTYRDEERRGEWQEGSWVIDEKVVVNEAAYYMGNLIT